MVLMVKSKGDPVTEEEKKEQEKIFRALSKVYCICNHKKDKHQNGEYECRFEASEVSTEKGVQIFRCECKLFQSIESTGSESTTVSFQ